MLLIPQKKNRSLMYYNLTLWRSVSLLLLIISPSTFAAHQEDQEKSETSQSSTLFTKQQKICIGVVTAGVLLAAVIAGYRHRTLFDALWSSVNPEENAAKSSPRSGPALEQTMMQATSHYSIYIVKIPFIRDGNATYRSMYYLATSQEDLIKKLTEDGFVAIRECVFQELTVRKPQYAHDPFDQVTIVLDGTPEQLNDWSECASNLITAKSDLSFWNYAQAVLGDNCQTKCFSHCALDGIAYDIISRDLFANPMMDNLERGQTIIHYLITLSLDSKHINNGTTMASAWYSAVLRVCHAVTTANKDTWVHESVSPMISRFLDPSQTRISCLPQDEPLAKHFMLANDFTLQSLLEPLPKDSHINTRPPHQ
jgi:hypothetical protein